MGRLWVKLIEDLDVIMPTPTAKEAAKAYNTFVTLLKLDHPLNIIEE